METNGGGFDARIASGGGRQNITMDRYDVNWKMVEKGWHTHVLGEGDQFASASAAVVELRKRFPGTIDQDLPPARAFPTSRPRRRTCWVSRSTRSEMKAC